MTALTLKQSPIVIQVVSGYEDVGLSVGEISLEYKLQVEVVKSILAKHSSKFREGIRRKVEEDISDGEFKELMAAYKNLALGKDPSGKRNDDIPHASREKALRFLINEKKQRNGGGGNNASKMGNVGVMNVSVYNQQVLKNKQSDAVGVIDIGEQDNHE